MFEKIKSWIIKVFHIERCITCNKILSCKDKKDGGAGFNNGKHFSYCVDCSQGIVKDIFMGKEPKLPNL